MKFLIADNDANRGRAIRSILSSLGYKSADVESVTDSKNALSTLKKKKFDCSFVADEEKAGLGMELLREIRNSPSLKSLPVIIISTEVSRDKVIAAGQAGANNFLTYPCSVADVESALSKIVNKKT